MVLKVKYSYSLALMLILLLGLLPEISFAQESEISPHEYRSGEMHYAPAINESLESDELLADDEKSNSRADMVKDSIASKYPSHNIKSAKSKNGSNNDSQKAMAENQKAADKNNDESEKEDSILSFNFLYYIFQKFKLSDIVDK